MYLDIDGGNFFSSDRAHFVGARERLRYGDDFEDNIRRYYGDKPIVHLGTEDGAQAEGHFDIYFTDLSSTSGKESPVVLVADMELGWDTVRSVPREKLVEYARRAYKEKFDMYYSSTADFSAADKYLTLVYDDPDSANLVERRELDEEAVRARQRGDRVVRLPYFAPNSDEFELTLTYNNMWVERYYDPDQGKTILRLTVPSYGIPELDGKVEEILKNEAGADIVDFVYVNPFSTMPGASLRCFSKILERE